MIEFNPRIVASYRTWIGRLPRIPPIFTASLILSLTTIGITGYVYRQRSPAPLAGRFLPLNRGNTVCIIDTSTGSVYEATGEPWESGRWAIYRDGIPRESALGHFRNPTNQKGNDETDLSGDRRCRVRSSTNHKIPVSPNGGCSSLVKRGRRSILFGIGCCRVSLRQTTNCCTKTDAMRERWHPEWAKPLQNLLRLA
jgi:hypothetical protein